MNVLGIDVGGSGIKGAVVNLEKGELLTERHRITTPQPATPKAVGAVFKQMIHHFDWKRAPIGVGFPAAILDGVAQTASNIHKDWIGTSVEDLILKVSGCPVKVVNDADAAGLAEATFGAGKGQSGLVILLTLGTGIGSALIMDGKLVPNSELGHLKFKGNIAERYASDATRRKEDLDWKEWGTRLNEYLNHVNRLFYPNMIILGGGSSKKFSKFADRFDVPTKVVPAQLLNQAGIVGAALAGMEKI